jgi:hypothetical protein
MNLRTNTRVSRIDAEFQDQVVRACNVAEQGRSVLGHCAREYDERCPTGRLHPSAWV